jgi:hypothetical protein
MYYITNGIDDDIKKLSILEAQNIYCSYGYTTAQDGATDTKSA